MLIPLPLLSRLQKLLKETFCQFGYNQLSLISIAEQPSKNKSLERCRIVLLNEMKVRKAVAFSKSTHKLDGVVDYCENNAMPKEEQADNAHVLKFVAVIVAGFNLSLALLGKKRLPDRC